MKILDVNKINPEGITDDMFKNHNPKAQNSNIRKISDSMLWHKRLDHATLNYLKQLQKNHKELTGMKFDESVKGCEICIMAKMGKQPCTKLEPEQIVHYKEYTATSWDLYNLFHSPEKINIL